MKRNPLSILLIEDSPSDALLLSEDLRQVTEFAFEMEHADTLETAVLMLEKKTYSAIILDLALPDSTGIKTFERVKAEAESIPIIILSGNDERSVLKELMNAGADNYLIKNTADGNRIAIAILSAIRNKLETRVLYNASIRKDAVGNVLGVFASAGDVTALQHAKQELAAFNEDVLGRSEARVEELNKLLEEHLARLELVNALLEESRDHALQASNLKSRFVATMSHELRTPLHGILSILEILFADQEFTNDRNTELLEMAQICGNDLLTLVNGVLDISKIEAGRQKIVSVAFEPVSLVQETTHILAESAQNKQLSLSFRCDSNLPKLISGDAGRLRQVLVNLISNSIKFTRTGEISLEVKVESHTEDQISIRFTVKDSGIGMSEDEQKLLFFPFSQVDSSDTRPYGGTGLGLFICKSFVDLMGGEIFVKSKQDEGSVFWFVLPFKFPTAASSDSASNLATLAESNVSASMFHDKVVLVVEDDPILQNLVVRQLTSLGVQVQWVSNGRNAIDAVSKGCFDLVFMDCNLPGISGFEATRQIRGMELHSSLPIVAMTAGAMTGDREKCINAGMTDYLSKPFTFQQLRQKLEEHVLA